MNIIFVVVKLWVILSQMQISVPLIADSNSKQLKDVSCCLLDTAGVASLYYILDYTD